jgi:hypothetical protein
MESKIRVCETYCLLARISAICAASVAYIPYGAAHTAEAEIANPNVGCDVDAVSSRGETEEW